LQISPNRAHANRAITPVALGIEPNFSGRANSVAKKCPGPLPGCGAKSQMIDASSQVAVSIFDYRPCAAQTILNGSRSASDSNAQAIRGQLVGRRRRDLEWSPGREAEEAQSQNTESRAQSHNNI
jgi:hypothetical protein